MAVIKDSGNIAVSDGEVTVNGWVQDIRNLGGISFLTLRDRHGTIQVTMPKKKIEPGLFELLTKLSRETVVSITGDVKESNQTALGLELIPKAAEVVSEAGTPLPMGVIDKVNVEMDTRLNHRFMDLRKPEVRALFELKSLMYDLIEEAVREADFVRINTPKISAAGAEGGAELFRVQYFDRPAYLSQSPQLYKQILMSTGLDRVYEIAPAFRAEQSNTTRHVTEFISFDGEMSWISNMEDVMRTLEGIIDYVLRGLKERGAKLLEGHLGGSGSGSLDVAGEGVGQDVLSGGVELHGLGDAGGLLEALPGGAVDVLVALALVVGHEQVDVVADAGDVEVLDGPGLLGVLQDVPGGLEHLGVGSRVSDDGSDVGLDYRNSDFFSRHE